MDRLDRQPSPQLWRELRNLLVVEEEAFCRASFAALPTIAALAKHSTTESRDEALALAADIEPATLTGIARWMHDIAAANGELTLADGLTHLFGDAGCPSCGSIFHIANQYEAENSQPPPIEPVVPR